MIYLISLAAFVVVFAGMAIGVILAKKPLKGTCGGLGAMSERFGQPMCEICDGNPERMPSDCSAPDWVKERCRDASSCAPDDEPAIAGARGDATRG